MESDDFQSSDVEDAPGDIINPMEAAEYYQGSFNEDDPQFAEYRSQGSNDDEQALEVNVEDIEELPEDVRLRQPQSSIPEVTPNVPNFVSPRPGLQINVDGDEEDDDVDFDDDPSAQISQMAEQVDNPYLLHYKNQSKMLKQELMGPASVPVTPSQDAQRDPEEEFFMLAVLALKMLHNEQYEDAEYVYEVSAAKLFKQVRSQQLPFHRWYKWLERKFADLREAFKRQ